MKIKRTHDARSDMIDGRGFKKFQEIGLILSVNKNK